MSIVLLIAVFAFAVNVPLGLLRSRCRRFSWKWFLYVHLSVPMIFGARILTHTHAIYIILFAAAAIAGQIAGSRIEFWT